jgi:predicted transposase YbfD/YdcC
METSEATAEPAAELTAVPTAGAVPEPAPAARDLVGIFSGVPDHRRAGSVKHKLCDVLTIATCTVLCDHSEFTEMETWGKLNEGWLRKFLELPNGIPSHDTFRAVFGSLDPARFLDAFVRWVAGVRAKVAGEVVALDGKALRGTKGEPGEVLTVVGAWAAGQGISLGQLQVEGKSNEITAVPLLLDLLDIRDCTVTTDAMGCQKEIAAKCVEKGADYVLALKGNQGNLHGQASLFLEGMIADGMEPGFTSEDLGRGRRERRRCWAWGGDLGEWLEGEGDWEGLQSVAALELRREEKGETTVEMRYFISSLPPEAQRIALAARSHWGVENSLHWVLDVVFGEDAARTRKTNAPTNLSQLRRLAHNLIKVTPTEKYGKWTIRKRKLAATHDRAYLAELLGIKVGA